MNPIKRHLYETEPIKLPKPLQQFDRRKSHSDRTSTRSRSREIGFKDIASVSVATNYIVAPATEC